MISNTRMAANSADSSPSVDCFSLLPHELITRIVDLACRPSPSTRRTAAPEPFVLDHGATAHGPLPALDGPTTLSLARVSRPFYALVTPLIWKHVWLTRQSQLKSFQEAVAARPSLGRLVKHFHAGPDNELPDWWFPLDDCGSYFESETSEHSEIFHCRAALVATTLRSEEESQMLPFRCASTKQWHLGEPETDRQSTAIHQALIVAQSIVDVDLSHRGHAYFHPQVYPHRQIAVTTGMQRVFEVHAAFELYLIKCGEVEREQQRGRDDCGNFTSAIDPRDCTTYPRLVITGSNPAVEADQEPASAVSTYVISRSDILRHLARPGAVTDRLDHPLLLFRLGWNPEAKLHFGGRYGDREELANEELEDFQDLYSLPSDYKGRQSFSAATSGASDPSCPQALTLRSAIGHLRSILSYCHLIENLSLTGFLEKAICGTRPATPLLTALRVVSLGPPPPSLLSPIRFESLHRIEELRVSGVKLQHKQATEIFSPLTTLKELCWRNPSEATHKDELLEIILLLIGSKATPAEAPTEPSPQATSEATSEVSCVPLGESVVATSRLSWFSAILAFIGYNKEGASSEEEDHHDLAQESETVSIAEYGGAAKASEPSAALLPLIKLGLHRNDIDYLLDNAPSEEARCAWESGSAWSTGLRRLLLVESTPPISSIEWSAWERTTDSVFEEGREWWLKHCGLYEEAEACAESARAEAEQQ